MICPHCHREVPSGSAYCPRCQNKLPSDVTASGDRFDSETNVHPPSNYQYHVSIIGHGIKGFVVKLLPFKCLNSEDLSVDVMTDGHFAGTVPPDGRLDLYLDKNPVEFRLCVKYFLPIGRWSTTLLSLEPRCCFQIRPSVFWKFERLQLHKIPTR